MRLWAERLTEADAKRVRFQHAYAEGIIGLEDLKARFAELDDIRTTAEQEIAAALNCLDAEERHRFYKMLRLRVRLWPDRSLEITGAFPEPLKVGAEVCTTNGSRS